MYRGDWLISLFGLAWGYIDCQDECSEQTSEDRLFNWSDLAETGSPREEMMSRGVCGVKGAVRHRSIDTKQI